MSDIASLGIKVATQGVQQAQQQLEGLASTGAKAEKAAGALEDAVAKLGKASGSTSKPLREQRDAIAALLGQIDPTTKALGRLDQQEQKLRAFRAKGLIDTDTFNDYAAKINASRAALSNFGNTASRTGLSAKQLAQATRGLPAQFTDIATSLASGQRPLQVLLQQGGQIKDMFGGIGPAFRAVGSAIVGLINPITLAAGAAGVLALAWKQGSDEAVAFNKALALTSDYAGLTAEGMQDLAHEIGNVTGSQHAASAALAEVATTGKFTAEQIGLVTKAAEQMRIATGRDVADTVKEFAKLADDPVRALLELNEKYHFLTDATYAQVTALQDQGREQEAQTAAMRIFAENVSTATGRIRQNLGLLERSWASVKSWASSAWDAMLGIGRAQTVNDRIADLQQKLASVQNPGFGSVYAGLSPTARANVIAKFRAEIEKLQGDLRATSRASAAKATAQQANEAAIDLDQEARQYASREEKRVREITAARGRANEAIRKALASGNKKLADDIRADLATIERGINEKYKDRTRQRKPRAESDPTESLPARIRQQIALNKEELDSQEKLTTSDRLRISIQQQLAELKGKVTAARRKEIDALLAELEASDKALVAKQEEAKLTDELTRLTNQLSAAEENRRQGNRIDLLQLSGIGREQADQLRRRLDIEREYADGLRALRDKGVAEDSEAYKRQEALLRASRDRMLSEEANFQQQRAALMSDWRNGARAAFADFQSDAQNTAARTYEIFSSAFDGLSDVLTDFITKGKGDWKGFLDDIARQITAFIIKQQLSKWLQGLFAPQQTTGQGAASLAAGIGAGLAGGTSSGGSNSAGFWSSLIGALFGDGRAIGGPVQAGRVYPVTEKGEPEILQMRGRSYLLAPQEGYVRPMGEGPQVRGGDTTNIYVQGAADRRTIAMIDRANGRRARREMARTGP